ncbi:hypothetical protein BDY24DRAFT_403728 [Mrakia frigida]|uniref:roadblock/LC7 domain-containing protein n=1 Tax=Mrakia frigida TaxID=29902 RepID=UPI003FCBFDA5
MSSSDPTPFPPSPSTKSMLSSAPIAATPSTSTPLPPQLAALLQSLSQTRSVLGVLLLSRTAGSSSSNTTVIRSQGSPFVGTKGREYAARIGKMVRNVEEGCSMEGGPAGGAEGDQAGVSLGFLLSFLRISGKGFKTCEEGADQFTFLPCPQDALKLLRIRTTKHELIITPDPNYVLVVLQDPGQ